MDVIETLELAGQLKAAAMGSVQAPARNEAVGDNVVDNMMDELKRAVDVEMGQFVTSLLNSNVMKFLYAYTVPQYEGFQEALQVVVERYQVMDGTEQGDLFAKIDNLFKDMFVDKYAALGPEAAELVAKKYAMQMVNWLKKQRVQANTELHQDKTRAVY